MISGKFFGEDFLEKGEAVDDLSVKFGKSSGCGHDSFVWMNHARRHDACLGIFVHEIGNLRKGVWFKINVFIRGDSDVTCGKIILGKVEGGGEAGEISVGSERGLGDEVDLDIWILGLGGEFGGKFMPGFSFLVI